MVNRCYVCKTCSYKEEAIHLSFHRLPRDPTERRIWLSCLDFSEQDIFPKSVLICSKHFRQSDFTVKPSGKRYLKPNVVPLPTHSLFNSPQMSSKRKTVEENDELPGPSTQLPPPSTIEHMVVQDFTTQPTGLQLSLPLSTSVSASDIETLEATAALITSKRERKYYAGHFTSSDFSSSNKAKKNYKILKEQLITQKKKIHCLQSTVVSLRKEFKNLSQLLKLLKEKSYIPKSSEIMLKA